MTAPVIWWIRRDMRLHDNPALESIAKSRRPVVPVFIVDSKLMASQASATKRLAFMFDSLRALGLDIERMGGSLWVRHGDPQAVLPQIMAESGATTVVAQRDYSSFARRRDTKVGERVPLELVEGLCVREPGEVHKPDGRSYARFTSFHREWRRGLEFLRPRPYRLGSIRFLSGSDEACLSYRPQGTDARYPAGEVHARTRADAFFEGRSNSYDSGLNLLDGSGTSGLSPYLRFGSVSARSVVAQAITSGAEAWLRELAWRDFYIDRLAREGESPNQGSDPVRWLSPRNELGAWRRGMTGYPVVDAAMRQLLADGWISNRLRMIVASFLTKHLLIDWRFGEKHFMEHLIDGDVASNRGGWRWVAGVGADASPYFRIFNPVSQAKKFDPKGDFVRRWVPELKDLPDTMIHEPWVSDMRPQRYPPPIVEHGFARARALDAFKEMRRPTR